MTSSKKRSTIPFGWLVKRGRRCLASKSYSNKTRLFGISDEWQLLKPGPQSVSGARCGWLIILGRTIPEGFLVANTANISNCCLPRWSVLVSISLFTIDDDDDDNDNDKVDDHDKNGFDRFRFLLKTRKTIPFGWPIKRDRRILLTMAARLPIYLPEAA